MRSPELYPNFYKKIRKAKIRKTKILKADLLRAIAGGIVSPNLYPSLYKRFSRRRFSRQGFWELSPVG